MLINKGVNMSAAGPLLKRDKVFNQDGLWTDTKALIVNELLPK